MKFDSRYEGFSKNLIARCSTTLKGLGNTGLETEGLPFFPAILAAQGSDLDAETKAGYTPLHVACHFGSVGMVRFLLERDVKIDVQVS